MSPNLQIRVLDELAAGRRQVQPMPAEPGLACDPVTTLIQVHQSPAVGFGRMGSDLDATLFAGSGQRRALAGDLHEANRWTWGGDPARLSALARGQAGQPHILPDCPPRLRDVHWPHEVYDPDDRSWACELVDRRYGDVPCL